MKIEQDDPRLTAYALGELSADERREVEAHLVLNESARRQVSEIRATADLLAQQLQIEQLRESDSIRQLKQRPIRLPKTAIPFGDRIQRWPARVFTVAVAASIVLIAGGIPLAIILGNRDREVVSVQETTLPPAALSAQPPVGLKPFPQNDRQKPVYSREASLPVADADTAPTAQKQLATEVAASVPMTSERASVPPQASEAPMNATVAAPTPSVAASVSPNDIVHGNVTGGRQFRGELAARSSKSARVQAQIQASQLASDPEDIARVNADARSNTETYDRFGDNPFLDVLSSPLSTFSIDVDTASYSTIRRFIRQNQLPPKEAVRIEEMLNYFPYDYAPPGDNSKDPFATHVEIGDCPWQPEHRLVRVALKARDIDISQRPPSNLVFLIDVSGSMADANKLPLLKQCMQLLVQQLDERDRVAIVTYAGRSGVALPSTSCAQKQAVLDALDQLESGGSTNGASGIKLAYETAVSNFIDHGSNRVMLCTDGDFNVGMSDPDSLQSLIEEKAKTGVFLSVLGFGMGNTKDATMERLADKGNGNYAYIDTFEEGHKVLVEQMSGTLLTIAKDVKIQVEFNPSQASAYRLIGYENRLLAKEDFNDDRKDAGEIGAGHSVTALYEVVPGGANSPAQKGTGGVDPLKYRGPAPATADARQLNSNELLTIKLRYKEPAGSESKLVEFPVVDAKQRLSMSSADFRFAAAVAELGMIFRASPHKGTSSYASVLELADSSRGKDPGGYRREFVELTRKARTLASK